MGFYRYNDAGDSRYQLKVTANHPDYVVRHRREVVLLTEDHLQRVQAEAALLRGKNADTLSAAVGKPYRSGLRKMELPVTLKIPVDQIEMVQDEDGQHHAELEMRMVAFGEHGSQVEAPLTMVPISGGAPQPGAFAFYETTFKMLNRGFDLVITLRDPKSGKVFTTRQTVEKSKLLEDARQSRVEPFKH